jgi:glutamate formiminotransferase
MNSPLVECVVNISEGRNNQTITACVQALKRSGAVVLHTDIGYGAHRTVVTYVVPPLTLIPATLALYDVVVAAVDMNKHRGCHPRLGAVDVCPLIPLTGCSMKEVRLLSHDLAQQIAERFDLPVFLYNYSALLSLRTELAAIRRGEYESLQHRLSPTSPESEKPDFGPFSPHPTAGATVVGCRDFLVAYNVSLAGKNIALARKIAAKIRIPSSLKAIGWYVEEYGCAQVSCNLTDLHHVTIVDVFDRIKSVALEFDDHVVGSELIGMIPEFSLQNALKVLSNSHSYLLTLEDVIEHVGLNFHYHFSPKHRIIERALADLLL